MRRFARDVAIIAVISTVLILCLGEAGIRILDNRRAIDLGEGVEPDEIRGWRAKANYQFNGVRKDESGVSRPVEFQTDSNGFRAFGAPDAARCKVFVAGDSYTFARDVSQNETFYAPMQQDGAFEVFAYGCDGYGTLQECFVLESWLAKIQPDLVVLQLCRNDFIGNTLALTRHSSLNQCQVLQPFLAPDGSIQYSNPADGPWTLALSSVPSRLLQFLSRRIDNRYGVPSYENSIEHEIEREGPNHPLFRESVKTTGALLARFKERCGAVPLLAFDVATIEPYYTAFRKICAEQGIPFLEEIPKSISQAHERGEIVFAEDKAHWNPRGHAIAGEILRNKARERCGESYTRP